MGWIKALLTILSHLAPWISPQAVRKRKIASLDRKIEKEGKELRKLISQKKDKEIVKKEYKIRKLRAERDKILRG